MGGDISHPRWKAATSLGYSNGGFVITGRWRYIDRSIHSDLVADPKAATPGIPAYNYFDLNAYYTFKERFTIGVGVTNIGDRDPPFVSGAPLTTDAATYDVVGRTVFASLKAKF